MSKSELTLSMARLVAKLLFAEDRETEEALSHLEETAKRQFPREHKAMEAQALNLAMGHRT